MQNKFKIIFFLIFGIVSIAFSLVLQLFLRSDDRNCTELVDAVIIDVDKDTFTRSGEYNTGSTVYTPIFKYNYDDVDYESHMDTYVSYDDSWIGSECKIYINPENPKQLVYKDIAKKSWMVSLIFIGIGIICIGKSFYDCVLWYKTD